MTVSIVWALLPLNAFAAAPPVAWGPRVTARAFKDAVLHLAFTADGKTICVGNESRKRFYEVASLADEEPWSEIESHGPMAFSPSGKHLASWAPLKGFRRWYVRTGRLVDHEDAHDCPFRSEDSRVTYSADGRTLAVIGARDGRMASLFDSFDLKLKNERDRHGETDGFVAAICRGGEELLVASRKKNSEIIPPSFTVLPKEVTRHDLKRGGSKTVTLAGDFATGMAGDLGSGHAAWSTDGGRLAASWRPRWDHIPAVLCCWDTRSGKSLFLRKAEKGGWPQRLCLGPDGSLLALLLDGGRLEVWDAASGRRLASHSFPQPKDELRYLVRCLDFSPDGKSLYAGTERGLVLAFDLSWLPRRRR